jgi:adenosine kinase
MNIFVSGSLAYDRIMDFPGKFSDHILPEKIHVLNVSFHVNDLKEKLGGTAGNIAYALSLLGEQPIILATLGSDHHRYLERLKKNGLSCQGIRIIENDYTAGAYIITDQSDNQITGFHPGAMKQTSDYCFDGVSPQDSLAIVAAGNLEDMKTYPEIYKSRGIPYIFDPGQSLPLWKGEDILRCIDGALLLISNDYELDLITCCTGLDCSSLLKKTKAVVTTMGELGSRVTTREGCFTIPAARPKTVVDPTGAGDAYRAGLIKGLILGKSLRDAAIMASVSASFAVECYGTQEYHFSPNEFEARLQEYLTTLGCQA